MEAWIEHYGYLAVLVGTFLEGQTLLVLAGFAAHRRSLELPWVIGAALVGTLFGDQLFFSGTKTQRISAETQTSLATPEGPSSATDR